MIALTGAVETAIPEELTAAAEALAESKYRTWLWNYGTAISYSYSKKRRFPFGSCQISFNVADNRIADFALTGDFFGSEPAAQASEYFNGVSIEPEKLIAAIKKFPVEKIIHGATSEDLQSLIDL